MAINISKCTEDEAEYIDDQLYEFNLAQVPTPEGGEFYLVQRKVTDDDGNIIGGCLAKCTPWNVAIIDILWVEESHRKEGIGTALMREVERVLQENGCYRVVLDTFDWQARGFYEKMGYAVFGALDDCPQGHTHYYMSKTL